MRRFPPFMIVAVCGILFLSAGMVIITADNADPMPQPPPPTDVPTATIELPTPTQVIVVPTEQPPQPVPPTDVPLPTAEPVQPTVVVPEVQPTVVVADPASVPTNAEPVQPTGVIPTVVVQAPNEPLGTLPPAPVVPTAENPVVIPTIVVLPTTESAGSAPPPVAPAPVSMTQVTGKIGAGLKADFSGILITLRLPDGEALQTITDQAGNFTFPNLAPGTYQISASAPGYLSSQISFTVAQGQSLTLPLAMLVGGDTNLDNKIDMADASLIAASFDTPNAVAGADLNHDGVVDIRDLSAIGAYYGKVGPTAWQPN